MALASGLASCDTEEPAAPLAIKSINAEYSVQLGQLWLDYYVITVEYRNNRGEFKTFNLTDTEKWSYSFSLSPENAPKDYCFRVLATPKKDYPEIDDNVKYVFEKNITCEFYSVRYNGEIFKELSSDLYPFSSTTNQDEIFTGTTPSNRMNGNHTWNLCNFSLNWDGKF